MSDNGKDLVCNLLTNTWRSGTGLTSGIYLIDTTKTNYSSSELTTSAFCNNYYSVLAHNKRSNANIEIVHPNQTLLYVPYMGLNMLCNDYPKRASAVDNFL